MTPGGRRRRRVGLLRRSESGRLGPTWCVHAQPGLESCPKRCLLEHLSNLLSRPWAGKLSKKRINVVICTSSQLRPSQSSLHRQVSGAFDADGVLQGCFFVRRPAAAEGIGSREREEHLPGQPGSSASWSRSAERHLTRLWSPHKPCAKIPHMDKVLLGQRLAEARDLAGMTQESVGRAVGLERTAIVLLEKGERNLKVPELIEIAQVLGRPLSYFVEPPIPAAVSRRSAPHTAHDSTRALDVEIDQFATDVRALLSLRLVVPVARTDSARVPRTHDEAESTAAACRLRAGLDSSPIEDLGRICEIFGLYTFAAHLGESGPDGGCIEVAADTGTVGVAVINGDAAAGRRRMTLAHELGHWLFGDAYDVDASLDNERMINSFAIHFLAPRAGVSRVWNENSDWPMRDRALAVGVAFRLSWSAVTSQLRNIGLISHEDRERLGAAEPRSGDYLRLGLAFAEELAAPYLSPGFVATCLTGYTSSVLTEARVLELLRSLLRVEDLPAMDSFSLDAYRRSFEFHSKTASDA